MQSGIAHLWDPSLLMLRFARGERSPLWNGEPGQPEREGPEAYGVFADPSSKSCSSPSRGCRIFRGDEKTDGFSSWHPTHIPGFPPRRSHPPDSPTTASSPPLRSGIIPFLGSRPRATVRCVLKRRESATYTGKLLRLLAP